MPESLIIIPTYNESGNIKKLITHILDLDKEFHVLVIDDNSPDSTGRIVEALAKDNIRIRAIHRPGKMGLGSAYIEGFKYALREGFKNILTMDADFSHNPRYIPGLVKTVEEKGADIAIGSRYVEGGKTVNWGITRKCISRSANLLAKYMGGLRPLDSTGGFRCYRSKVIDRINLGHLRSNGYSFLMEMLFMCQRHNFKIKEVPVIFEDRRVGISKISRREVYKAVVTLIRLLILRLNGYGKDMSY
jgi:glycosyltransferase involved in cell wall biosynthesis